MLSFQGKVLSVDVDERAELAEATDNMDDDANFEEDRDIDNMVVSDGSPADSADATDFE